MNYKNQLLIIVVLCFSSVWGQKLFGTGLEMDPLNGFSVLVGLDADAERIGFNKASIEAKVKLALRKNGTPAGDYSTSTATLGILIWAQEIKYTNGQREYNCEVTFGLMRPVSYTKKPYGRDNKTYKKHAVVYELSESPFMRPTAKELRTDAIEKLMNNVDRFSIDLLEANGK